MFIITWLSKFRIYYHEHINDRESIINNVKVKRLESTNKKAVKFKTK